MKKRTPWVVAEARDKRHKSAVELAVAVAILAAGMVKRVLVLVAGTSYSVDSVASVDCVCAGAFYSYSHNS